MSVWRRSDPLQSIPVSSRSGHGPHCDFDVIANSPHEGKRQKLSSNRCEVHARARHSGAGRCEDPLQHIAPGQLTPHRMQAKPRPCPADPFGAACCPDPLAPGNRTVPVRATLTKDGIERRAGGRQLRRDRRLVRRRRRHRQNARMPQRTKRPNDSSDEFVVVFLFSPPAGGAKRANTPKWGPWTDERGARERNRDGGLELPGFRKQRKVRLHALS